VLKIQKTITFIYNNNNVAFYDKNVMFLLQLQNCLLFYILNKQWIEINIKYVYGLVSYNTYCDNTRKNIETE